ncbi:FAD-dependent oxidoreductase, partial [uncultured Nocardioides sp.]|uniref:FAD-dependent oxidoreductase n=1 Tax=uncultured Nocardioides sp. TaxID=198441 RepID=UPI002637C308
MAVVGAGDSAMDEAVTLTEYASKVIVFNRGDRLTAQAKKHTILLANPPFDNFTPQEQQAYRDQRSEVCFF